MTKNIASSIRQRLLNLAKSESDDFNNMLVRFALERFLYRLSRSKYVNHFLLKGALLFTLWYDMPHRATRDIDLLGFGSADLVKIKKCFCEIASIDIADGVVFDPDSITVEQIRKNMGYSGIRVTLSALLDKAQCKTQMNQHSNVEIWLLKKNYLLDLRMSFQIVKKNKYNGKHF